MAYLKTETVHGIDFKIEVNNHGSFCTNLDDVGWIEAGTLAELIEKVRATLKKQQAQKPIDVTFFGVKRVERKGYDSGAPIAEGGNELIDGILRGLNTRTRAMLITLDGKKYQVDGYSELRDHVARQFTPKQAAEYRKLRETLDAAQAAVDAFLKPLQIDPRTVFGKESANG